MARIKIEDLPVLENLSPKEKKKTFGGATLLTTYEYDSWGSEDELTLAGSTEFRRLNREKDGF